MSRMLIQVRKIKEIVVEPETTAIYKFDGVDDYVDFGNPDYTNGSFSAGCWFKTTDDSLRLWQKRGMGSGLLGWQISYSSLQGGWYNIAIDIGGGNLLKLNDVLFLEGDNNWHNLYFTFDISTGTAKLYINGILKLTNQNNLFINCNFVTTRHLTLGNAWNNALDTNQQIFHGSIYDARIYNRAITASEINQIFTNGTIIQDGLKILIPKKSDSNIDNVARNDFGVNGTIFNQNPNTFFGTL